MPTITTPDGVEIYYKDWGPQSGPPIVLAHGWPLSADSWEAQQLHLADNGFRAIAHDRRGHGRSTQVWDGNDMDHYADDLAAMIEQLDLRDVILVGFSTGGGEVARYIGRHGTARVAKLALVSAVPPFMLKTEDNPGGVPIEVFDGIRAGSLADRSQLYRDLADGPFFGNNRRRRSARASATPSGVRACSPATRTPTTRSPPSARPTCATTCEASTCRRSSSTATPTRWSRSPSVARRAPHWSRARG